MIHPRPPSEIGAAIAAHAEQAGQPTTEYLASEHGRAVARALAAQADDTDDDCPRIVALVTLCEVCCVAPATLETDGEFHHVCADCARLES